MDFARIVKKYNKDVILIVNIVLVVIHLVGARNEQQYERSKKE